MEAQANSWFAFSILANFCTAEGISSECALALTIVLTFPEHSGWLLELPSLSDPTDIDRRQVHIADSYNKLCEHLNRCITLTCSLEGIASILCSVFFDPTVPCNLAGAHLSGIKEAFQSIKEDSQLLARLMALKDPKSSLLWFASIRTHRASRFLECAQGRSQPINLAVASWTDTVQSFIHAEYEPICKRHNVITWAREYSTYCMVKPGVRVPFTPWPPFGEVLLSNASLEVQEHLPHHHRPLWRKTSWVLEGQEEFLVQQHHCASPVNTRLPSLE